MVDVYLSLVQHQIDHLVANEAELRLSVMESSFELPTLLIG